jgi:starch synthase
VYNKDFEGALNEELVDKIKFDKIDDAKIDLLKEPNYTNIIKSAITNSDAVVLGSDLLPKELTETINDKGLPVLSYQSEDSFEPYLDFYRGLVSED